MKYDLARMVKGRRPGTRAQLPVMEPPISVEREYLAQLRKIEHEAARCFREILLPKYRTARPVTADSEESDFETMRQLIAAVVRGAIEQVRRIVRLEGRRHTKAWMTAARRTFGIDLAAVVREEDLDDYLEQAALRNAGLIRSLGDDLVKRVQFEVTTALINGEAVSKLQERIKEQLAISDRRAQLIARDQTGKLTSDLNRLRHEQAGVNEYIWRTSHDERVRPRHRALDGKRYRYGEPTGAEEGLPPGQPIRCRCVAQGVVEF